jgi:hypothetical protein
MRNVSDKTVEKIKAHILGLIIFFPKIVPLMKKCGRMSLNGTGHT